MQDLPWAKMSRSPRLGSVTYIIHMVSTTPCFLKAVLSGQCLLWEMVGEMYWYIPRTGQRVRSLKLLESSLQDNQLSCPFRDLLQQEYKVVQLNWKMTCLFLIKLNINLLYIIQLLSCVNRKKMKLIICKIFGL